MGRHGERAAEAGHSPRASTLLALWRQIAGRYADLAGVAAWGRERRLPLFIGEFGAFSAADPVSRAR
ncbi:hypothetical protein [Amycolatopsis plumensis]|uniref:Uncharacterized protein n=1 Tax=Amycolatopsis plumensis TaxID=236508 RepID=A0ABV5UKQ6_9PSEU